MFPGFGGGEGPHGRLRPEGTLCQSREMPEIIALINETNERCKLATAPYMLWPRYGVVFQSRGQPARMAFQRERSSGTPVQHLPKLAQAGAFVRQEPISSSGIWLFQALAAQEK